MQRRVWFAVLVCVLAISALGYAGWKSFTHTDADQCYACKRPIHAHSRTVAIVDGRTRLFCCPACALSQREQKGTPISITRLTSFLTGKALSQSETTSAR